MVRRREPSGRSGCSASLALSDATGPSPPIDLATINGALATLCSTATFVPQAWNAIRTRDTAAISTGMYAVTVAGFSLWLAYGLLLWQWPLIVTNGVCLALSAFILATKVLPRPQKKAVAEALDPTT